MRLTFKQFLQENIDLTKYAKYSPVDVRALPEMSGTNAESQFRVGNIPFNQINGLGAVPNNQSVMYFGFIGMMKPAHFQEYAFDIESGSTRPDTIIQLIRDGYATASPFLTIDIGNALKNNGPIEVLGHEGRARTAALHALQPNVDIPVHFFVAGLRARHVTPEILTNLNSLFVREGTSTRIRGQITSVWHNYSHIQL